MHSYNILQETIQLFKKSTCFSRCVFYGLNRYCLPMVYLYHCVYSSGTERKMAEAALVATLVEGSRSRSFVKYFGGTIKGLVEFLKSTRTIRVPSFPLTDTLASSLDGLHSRSPRNLELTRTSHLIRAQKNTDC